MQDKLCDVNRTSLDFRIIPIASVRLSALQVQLIRQEFNDEQQADIPSAAVPDRRHEVSQYVVEYPKSLRLRSGKLQRLSLPIAGQVSIGRCRTMKTRTVMQQSSA